MKSTGIIRRIDDLGRVVIPREVRRTLNLKEGDPLEIFVEGEMLCFQKYYAAEGYRERIKSLVAGLNEDFYMENSAEIKTKLNEVLVLLSGKDYLSQNSDKKPYPRKKVIRGKEAQSP